MKNRLLPCIVLAFAVLPAGCRAEPEQHTAENSGPEETAVTAVTAAETTQTETTAAPEAEPYTFNPHVYSPMLSPEIPQTHWDAFYHLCDALREGQTTFACENEEAYRWATDSVVLGHLFPPACMKISGESDDGSVPFENGTGRIYYKMPAAEYVKRQADFEELVTDVLNSCLEPDDDDFEKCLKLYDYMESNYSYDYASQDRVLEDGAHYNTMITKKGICSELSGVHAYLLMQVGVDAQEVGIFVPEMCHSWTYVVLDGKGYHIDPTWSLKSDLGTDQLNLEYFMMSDAHRINDGCPVDDLTVDLLPEYWVSYSSLSFSASDESFSTQDYATFDALDEEKKILYYTDLYGNPCEMHYGSDRNRNAG